MLGRNKQLLKIILTALFAAIIYIGIWVLRIPIPAMVGRPFIHFGNPLMVLAILFLGGVWGGAAAAIGLGGFDVLNGYAVTSWLTVLEVVVMAIVVSAIMRVFRHDDRPSHIISVGILAGITKLITSYLVSVVEGLMVGMTFKPALIAAFLSLPATAINSLATAIIVPILYFMLRPAFRRIQ
ncbi:MAG: ECF transporter S component [Schleiferilactobacillus perolens]|uniref:ECF transporter S component n=1 Tax=Schleiferilactobacillus perolens TaxID=100468 RepID=UPI0039E96B3A